MSPQTETPELRPATGESVEPERQARLRQGVGRRMLRLASSAVVITVLAGAAYWGHHTGWTFSARGHGKGKNDDPSSTHPIASVRFGQPVPTAARLPSSLRRSATIEFESSEAVSAAGIDITPAWRGPMTEAVAANGELGFDPARVARLSPRAPGPAWRVLKAMGDRVRAGEVMALIDASEVGKAKAEYQQALVHVRLKRQVFESLKGAAQAASAQRVREAEAALKDAEVKLLGAEQALTNLGLPVSASEFASLSPDEVARRIRLLGVSEVVEEKASATANLLPVRAPFDGIVLNADVVAGEVVDTGKVLFVVVDPSRLWLTLHVGPEDAPRVSVGREVRFRPDGLSEDAVGRVAWVGTAADETTRTVPVRVELANKTGQLRASTFGKGRVVLREEREALLVPSEAVQSIDGRPIVFVRDPGFLRPGGKKAFSVRPVRVGAKDAQSAEILSGLEPGEVVATKGSGLLRDEFKRSLPARPAAE